MLVHIQFKIDYWEIRLVFTIKMTKNLYRRNLCSFFVISKFQSKVLFSLFLICIVHYFGQINNCDRNSTLTQECKKSKEKLFYALTLLL